MQTYLLSWVELHISYLMHHSGGKQIQYLKNGNIFMQFWKCWKQDESFLNSVIISSSPQNWAAHEIAEAWVHSHWPFSSVKPLHLVEISCPFSRLFCVSHPLSFALSLNKEKQAIHVQTEIYSVLSKKSNSSQNCQHALMNLKEHCAETELATNVQYILHISIHLILVFNVFIFFHYSNRIL